MEDNQDNSFDGATLCRRVEEWLSEAKPSTSSPPIPALDDARRMLQELVARQKPAE